MIITVKPAKSLRGELATLPADKSVAHRAAIFAALAKGESVIENYSLAADPQSTLQCLRDLGVFVKQNKSQVVISSNGRLAFKPQKTQIDCGNSGTTMRLLSGIVAGAGLDITLTGDASLSSRPMKRVIEPLRTMGAKIESSPGDRAPIRFLSHEGLKPIEYILPVASAQVKSCVLLAGLFANGETRVIEKLPSRDHTERMLGLPSEISKHGARILKSSSSFEVKPGNTRVPNDISAAAFWMVAASIVPDSDVKLMSVGINPSRNAVIDILKRMGADIEVEVVSGSRDELLAEPVADIRIRSASLKAVQLHENEIPNCIDEIPVLAVAMAFADGHSEVRNAAELRAKECDRISAVVEMLQNAGVNIIEHEDGFEIAGNQNIAPKSSDYRSFHDHRIAMAASVLSLKSAGESTVADAECVSISYPDFYMHLSELCQ
ncbi:MAG: 3-phosphoshikimate 1-carboxyvinyltransferase [Balneolales bacterium]|nr:3-phosphoshikimate 1-carboxyvinyltransferase [Balneolales bacterium]